MPYIPKEHEKYDLLPFCRKDGGEVFEYPGELIYEAERLLDSSATLMPYNYESYEEYYNMLDSLIEKYSKKNDVVDKLKEVRNIVWKMNQKEEWSILRYIGASDEGPCGLTNGKNYYWPSRKEKPVYCGVIDDEEFTAYLYPTEPALWEILEDPTGMAYRTLFEKAEGYYSQEAYDDYMEQIRKDLERWKNE